MPPPDVPLREPGHLGSTSLRDLGLTIAGSPLANVIHAFENELVQLGLTRLMPHFYLSTEWGVPAGTISIAIPFYLARVDLTTYHAERAGHVEGSGEADILRYFRHEMGHVVNYAYRLHEQRDWIDVFGPFETEYVEEYRPKPFSRSHVRHLPGWYAQKHPDEDWAETFAVWMTPQHDWRSAYGAWPEALRKLEYCDRTIASIREREPLVTATELDEEVGTISTPLDEWYRLNASEGAELGAELDEDLRGIFESADTALGKDRLSAADLIRRLTRDLMAEVFRWTGQFPERTRSLLQHMAARADRGDMAYRATHESVVALALTTVVTALAMNRVLTGRYLS